MVWCGYKQINTILRPYCQTSPTRSTHLLRPPDGDEAADPGLWAALGQTSDEEAALGEAHRVVTICR